MALKSGLALYCYALAPGQQQRVVEYAAELVGLSFTTVAPGGCGQLSAVLQLPNAQLPRPELSLMARLSLMAGPVCLFVGEITDPEPTLDEQYGEYVKITALGIGNSLRDDPLTVTYTNQTVQAMAINQLSRRAAYLPIDQDTSQVFPDNPSGTFNPAYANRNMEEVISDLAQLAGDYAWGVWPHPINRDSAGFATGQLVVHQRDTSTTHYQASLLAADAWKYNIKQSAERAYNVVAITYSVSTTSGYTQGTATYTDPRLNADGSQGTAPFRRRVYGKDLSSITTVNASQAQALANTYGAQFQNPSNIADLTLVTVRDAQGNPLPLWMVSADKNLFIPELATRGAQLATSATAGVNQFYLVQTTYTEQPDGTTTLEVQGDNYVDTASLQIARLQLWSDGLLRAQRTTGTIQATGAPETGGCGFQGVSGATGNAIVVWQPFRALMSNAPTSINLTRTSASNVTSVSVTGITTQGFRLVITPSVENTNTYWFGTYQTVGNCLKEVDESAGRVVWHCDRCEEAGRSALYPFDLGQHVGGPSDGGTHDGKSLIGKPIIAQGHGTDAQALAVVCPVCGLVESFHTGLGAHEEEERTHGSAHRAEQARLIRALMRHPAVGMTVR